MLIVAMLALPSSIGTKGIGIEYALAIPGFNPILPLSYGIAALVVAVVVHEMAHGIQSRSNGIDVDSTGLLYGVVPLGAFVEPNEKQVESAPRRPKMDIYAAGITVNTVVAIISVVAVILSCGAIASPYGDEAGVYSMDKDSPALDSGVPLSALIVGAREDESDVTLPITSTTLNNVVSFGFEDSAYKFDPTHRYYLRYIMEGDERDSQVPVQMGAYIKTVVQNSPAEKAGLQYGNFIYSITINGSETLIGSSQEFSEFMKTTSPGDMATIATVSVGDSPEIVYHDEVALSDSSGNGFLGVSVTMGGFTLTTPDHIKSIASNPFAASDGSAISYVKSFFSYLSGPMDGMTPINDSMRWWYDMPMGDVGWVILSLLYWLFWIDILLAISNALPAYPFDGGFIFAGGIDWLLEKLGVRDEEKRSKTGGNIASAVSNVVLLMFLLLIISLII
jgi:membrane-associated protease RseP (regulator of RpoE activity)